MTTKERVRLPKRERVRLPKRVVVWKPKWEPEIRGWTVNYVSKNKWCYEHTNDFEDLMQDAFLVFLKVCESYPRCVEAPHFMALYKTALRNTFFDKSRYLERKRGLIDESVAVDEFQEGQFTSLGTDYNEGPLWTLITSAPKEVRMFFSFFQDEEKLTELQKPQREKKGEPRLTFDQRVSKLLGVETFPFRSTLREMLT